MPVRSQPRGNCFFDCISNWAQAIGTNRGIDADDVDAIGEIIDTHPAWGEGKIPESTQKAIGWEPIDVYTHPDAIEKIAAHLRWPNGVNCVACGSANVHRLPVTLCRPRWYWKCNNCDKQFTVVNGTALADSALPLDLLFALCCICAKEDQLPTSVALAKYLGITQKTAWTLLRRLKLTVSLETIKQVDPWQLFRLLLQSRRRPLIPDTGKD